ncbi:MAG: FAD-dependent oxidoreductase [Solirubrobacteraceae bacterium]|nr:FAD-dependent oxidoreductase [Solirubrobacteraceae bacterium]
MSTPQTVVIAGAGLAGAKAAETLREEGYDGRIVLLGAERRPPYERPPLSKEYLRGEAGLEKVFVHDEDFYDEHAIELRLGETVESIDTAGSAVVLAGRERVPYDRLLLATGARPRRLAVPGAELDGVCELRTLGHSDALRERLRAGGRVAIVGGGWIGCEVAASARSMGLEVTLVEPLDLPLQRTLGPQLGAFYRDLHAEHGVRMLLGRGVAAFEGRPGGAIDAVRTGDGARVECDVAVVGVGVVPRDEIAGRSGICTADGILVDEYLETSAHNVFAAGDVARAHHPLLERSLRVEHWAGALHQGPAAARNMLGARVAYDRLPYFFSDQYDIGMEYTGHAAEWDDVVIRGDIAAREFIAFWLRQGRVRAAMNVNVWDMAPDIQALIGAAAPVERDRLADPSVALGDLLPAGVREV